MNTQLLDLAPSPKVDFDYSLGDHIVDLVFSNEPPDVHAVRDIRRRVGRAAFHVRSLLCLIPIVFPLIAGKVTRRANACTF